MFPGSFHISYKKANSLSYILTATNLNTWLSTELEDDAILVLHQLEGRCLRNSMFMDKVRISTAC